MALSDQNIFCYFARIVVVFFVLHHQYLIVTSCLFFFCLYWERRQCIHLFFRHLQHPAYTYIFKSLTKQDKNLFKKKLHYCVGPCRRCWSVHQSLESLFNLFFFSAFCTIYNRFSSSYWRLLDSSFPFSRHYALHSNRLYLICISNNNKTQERKSL